MSKTKFYNLSALIILAVFQMWDGIEEPGGLLINGFLTLYFYVSKNYQRHIRTIHSRYFHLEI